MIAAFIFLFGLIIGSFLNVVIYRYNTGRTVMGRSRCSTCATQLKWYELVPVFSFIAQGGKCRTCGARMSWQYPAVELLTALLFLGSYLMYDLSGFFVIDATIFSLLVVILFYDLKHKIIPNGFVYTFAFLAFVKQVSLLAFGVSGQMVLYGLLAGIGMALAFFMLWLVSGGRWIGLGDAKLVLGIGWFLGLVQGISALFIAFWMGAVVGVVLMVISRTNWFTGRFASIGEVTRKTELPFAPFLIAGLIVVYFFQFDVLHLNLLL